jgi:hypothetical protein
MVSYSVVILSSEIISIRELLVVTLRPLRSSSACSCGRLRIFQAEGCNFEFLLEEFWFLVAMDQKLGKQVIIVGNSEYRPVLNCNASYVVCTVHCVTNITAKSN